MSVDNNTPRILSSNAIDNQANTEQQDWLDLDQQDVIGETLKAKKWTTERGLADDSSHHGNIHTGTKESAELDKTDTLSGKVADYTPVESRESQEIQTNDQIWQQLDTPNRNPDDASAQEAEEYATDSSDGISTSSPQQSVVTTEESTPLVFEEKFDQSSPTKHSTAETKNSIQQTAVEPTLAPASRQTPTVDTEHQTSTPSAVTQQAELVSELNPSFIQETVSDQNSNSVSESPITTIENDITITEVSTENVTESDIPLANPSETSLEATHDSPAIITENDVATIEEPVESITDFNEAPSLVDSNETTLETVNDTPVITTVNDINITEESMEGFTGYGETWEGDIYSVVTQAEMLAHLGISDTDSDTFTVSLANADTAWHDGLQANDSVFSSSTLASDSANGDETVIQVTQEFLDNYPTVDAEVGDFYFDHVDFDKLSEGEIANINFSVQVSDGVTTSTPSNFQIVVTGSNDAPIVSGEIILPNGREDTSQTFSTVDLLANATDIDATDTLSVANVSVDPAEGLLTVNPDGTFTFTPKENYNGAVTINYEVTDGIEIIPATASLDLAAVNDNPIAENDWTPNQQVHLNGNDTSLIADSSIIMDNSEPYTVSLDITPAEQDYGYIISNGGQTRAATGFFVTRGVFGQDNSIYQIGIADGNQSIVFQGGQAENGQQTNLTFTYDGHNLTVYQDGIDITETGTISVGIGRDLPMHNVTLGAPSNILTSYEFKGESDNILIYDTALDASEVEQIQDGTIPNQEELLVHYNFEGDTPLIDQSGNGHNLQSNGNVQFDETINSEFSTDEDSTLTINADTLLANDMDVDGNTLSISTVSENVIDTDGNVVGTAMQNAEGNIVFTPGESLNSLTNGENTTVHFTYTIDDRHGGTDTATVAINVTGTNDGPVAVDDKAATTENSVITLDVLTNDSDIDGTHLTVSEATTEDGAGTVTINDDGTIAFDPGTDFDNLAEGETQEIQINYTLADNQGGSDTATATVTVTGTNETPVINTITTQQVAEDGETITGIINSNDVDTNDSVTYSASETDGLTFNADGSYSFDPTHESYQDLAAGETQDVTVAVTATDSHGATDTKDLVITVTGANDDPVATDDSYGQSISFNGVDNYITSDALDNFVVEGAWESEISLQVDSHSGNYSTFWDINAFQHVPAGEDGLSMGIGKDGQLGFQFKLDGNNSYNVKTDIEFGEKLDIKFGVDDTNHIYVDINGNRETGMELPEDYSASNWGNSSFTMGTNSAHYSDMYSDIEIHNISLPDGTYYDFEGATLEEALLDKSENNHNATAVKNPALMEDDAIQEDTALTINADTLLANDTDVDGDTLSITEVTATDDTHGTVTLDDDGNVLFTPEDDYNGEASFTYTVSDGQGSTDTANVTVMVSGTNDAPVIKDSVDLGAIKEDTEIKFEASDLLQTTTDVDGDQLSILDVSVDKEFGSIEYSTDKEGNVETVKFIPNENFTGEDVPINFVATDGQIKVEGKASIDVTAVNDAPVASNDLISTDTNIPEVSIVSTGFEDNTDNNPDVYNQFSREAGVTVDGEHYRTTRGTGITVLDSDGKVVSHNTFDTHGDSTASNNLVAHLQEIKFTVENGGSIIITTQDEWTSRLSDEAKEALEDIGATESTLNDAEYRSSYVLVSKKSDGEWNSTQEDYQPRAADTPLTNQLSDVITEDSSLTIDVLGNDSDIDGNSLSIQQLGDAVDSEGNIAGTVTIVTVDGKEQVQFTPNTTLDALREGDTETVTFEYTVSDGSMTDTATTTIQIVGTDDKAVLKDDTNTISELSSDETSNPIEGNILANDSDADSTLAVVGISNTNSSDVRILSRGFEDNLDDNPEVSGEFGGLAGVTVDGEHYRTTRGTGITVLGSDGQVLSHETFDTYGDIDASNNLVTHLSEINNTAPDGVSIIITTNDEWTANLSDEAKDALENIGGTESTLNDAGHRSSYVLVSEKSAGEWNTTQEAYQPKAADEPLLFRVQENGTVYSPEESSVNGSTTLEGAVGTVTINPDGTYAYELDDSNSDVKELQDGESLTETFTIQVQDEPGHTTTETLTITVTGANDDTAPVLFTDQNDTISLSTDDPEYQTGRTYNALDGDDHITGGGGDDTILGGGGNDIIDGGEGTDSVHYSGNIADYAITQNDDNSFTIADSVEGRDGTDTVVNVESFEFADGTVSSANLLDGAVEGIEYSTTSGLHGYTNQDGGFLFAEGDEVTFNIGGVVLGVATAEDVKTGQTFLQDIADVDRTDLNDEYLENMATFLQSLDENNDAYDGIVITDEIREALADSNIDLRTASEEDVQQLVEQVGKSYVSEEAAMEHVEDMLVEHTELMHDEFQEHLDDNTDDFSKSIRTEQNKANQTEIVAAATVSTEAANSEAEQLHCATEPTDLSLHIPSLDLPGEAQEDMLTTTEEEASPVQQEAPQQAETAAPQEEAGLDTRQDTHPMMENDLSNSLPTESLSNLFEDPQNGEETTASEHNSNDNNNSETANSVQATEVTVTSEEIEVQAVTPEVTQATQAIPVQQAVTSQEQNNDSTHSTEDSVQNDTQNDSVLSTDALHIELTEDNSSTIQEEESIEATPLADFSTSGNSEDTPLVEFSANNTSTDDTSLTDFSAVGTSENTEVMTALEEIDTTGATNAAPVDNVDPVANAGLDEGGAILEEIVIEPEPVIDTNSAV